MTTQFIGTGADQVPVNGMLGDLAFQNAAQTTVLSAISGPNGSAFGFRNKIINGGMQITQRSSATLTNTPAYNTIDRFLVSNSGTGITASPVLAENIGWQSGYVMQIFGSWTSGANTVTQRIERANVSALRSTTVTVQTRVYHTFGAATDFSISLYKANTSNVFSSVTQIGAAVTTSVPTGAVRVISATFTLGSSDASTGLEVRIAHAANSVTNQSLIVGDVQLEEGSVATPFSLAGGSIGGELSLCQRYYESGNTGFVATHCYANGSAIMSRVSFNVRKRITPVMAATPSGFAEVAFTAFTAFQEDLDGFSYTFTTPATAPANGYGALQPWSASAEL